MKRTKGPRIVTEVIECPKVNVQSAGKVTDELVAELDVAALKLELAMTKIPSSRVGFGMDSLSAESLNGSHTNINDMVEGHGPQGSTNGPGTCYSDIYGHSWRDEPRTTWL